MALIIRAQILVRFVPMTKWHGSLGEVIDPKVPPGKAGAGRYRARAHAARINRAASRFPKEPKCLAQAMALQWLMRKENLRSRLVIAMDRGGVRGSGRPQGGDAFHAWVELDDEMLIGACDRLQYRTLLTFGR